VAQVHKRNKIETGLFNIKISMNFAKFATLSKNILGSVSGSPIPYPGRRSLSFLLALTRDCQGGVHEVWSSDLSVKKDPMQCRLIPVRIDKAEREAKNFVYGVKCSTHGDTAEFYEVYADE